MKEWANVIKYIYRKEIIEEDTGQYERVGPCNIYKIYTRIILFIEEVEFGLYFAGAVLPTSHLKIFHLRHVSKMWHYHIGYGQTLSFWAAHICCTC